MTPAVVNPHSENAPSRSRKVRLANRNLRRSERASVFRRGAGLRPVFRIVERRPESEQHQYGQRQHHDGKNLIGLPPAQCRNHAPEQRQDRQLPPGRAGDPDADRQSAELDEIAGDRGRHHGNRYRRPTDPADDAEQNVIVDCIGHVRRRADAKRQGKQAAGHDDACAEPVHQVAGHRRSQRHHDQDQRYAGRDLGAGPTQILHPDGEHHADRRPRPEGKAERDETDRDDDPAAPAIYLRVRRVVRPQRHFRQPPASPPPPRPGSRG